MEITTAHATTALMPPTLDPTTTPTRKYNIFISEIFGSNANVMATVMVRTTTATPMARPTTTRVMASPSTLLLRASETRHAIYHHCGVYPQLRQNKPHCGREVADMM
jgi:hypothetical protein